MLRERPVTKIALPECVGYLCYELFCSQLDVGLAQCDGRCLSSHDEDDCGSSGDSIEF